MQIYSISVPSPLKIDGRKYLLLKWFDETSQYYIKKHLLLIKAPLLTLGSEQAIFYNDYLTYLKNTR